MSITATLKSAARLLALDPKSITLLRWKLDRGDATLRLNYDLGPDSVVFDVGGYRGAWARAIASRYHCRIHVFEPIAEYCREIERHLGGDPKIVINETGLADHDGRERISIDESASSVVKAGANSREITLVDIDGYVKRHGIDRIDLIKINIEGGEYALLPRMDATGLLERCGDVQIQFHDFVQGARERRKELRRVLSRTHDLTYDYPFIWENWHLRGRARYTRGR